MIGERIDRAVASLRVQMADRLTYDAMQMFSDLMEQGADEARASSEVMKFCAFATANHSECVELFRRELNAVLPTVRSLDDLEAAAEIQRRIDRQYAEKHRDDDSGEAWRKLS